MYFSINYTQLYNDFRKFRLMPDISEVTSPLSPPFLAPSSKQEAKKRGGGNHSKPLAIF